jgi:hypothetical protein
MLTKRIYNLVSQDELGVDLRSRDAIIKLKSLVHNQLSSSLFKPMISYVWSTCGYIPNRDAPIPIRVDSNSWNWWNWLELELELVGIGWNWNWNWFGIGRNWNWNWSELELELMELELVWVGSS